MKDSILGDLYYYKEMLSNRIMRKEFFKERITDGSPIIWNSCLNMYHITFSKQEVQTFYNASSFHYVIKMEATDGIGIPLFTLTFTEFDVVDLITNIVSQLYDINEFYGRDTDAFPLIRIDDHTGSPTDTFLIDLIMIPDFPEEIPFGESIYYCELYNECRAIRLDMSYYNSVEQRMIKALSVPVSITEALDIVDCLLCIVSDIELPTDQDEVLKFIVDNLDDLYWHL